MRANCSTWQGDMIHEPAENLKLDDFRAWWRLSEFSLDLPEIHFSFSDRLARENGWSKEYTNRVIEEYKKFVFLSFSTRRALTPSDEVDQAWHLHMIYTKSYWDEMCMGILGGFKLYHGPTKGGRAEAKRFDDQYREAKELYTKVFKSAPPSDIWPSAEKRFSPADWKRIDVTKNFVLSKRKVKEYLISYASPVAGALVIYLFTGSTSKEESNFWWWVLGIAAAIFLIRGIYRYLNRHERRSKSSSSYGSSDSGCSVVSSFFGCGIGDSGCSSSGCSSSGCSSSGCSSSGCGGGCGGCGS